MRAVSALALGLLAFGAGLLAQDGPLTNLANLLVRTDANGYLIAASQTYTGPDGPRRTLANAQGRTDANGYLIITNPTGFGGAPTDATYLTQTANVTLTAEQAMGSLGTGLVLNTTITGVQSIYGGVTCTNQFLRALSAAGAGTCATVTLTDTSGLAPSDAGYWVDTANATLSAERNLGALTTGLVLNTVTAGVGVPSAYAGTSCTNQFPRSLNASGAATCATVGITDTTNIAPADATYWTASANGTLSAENSLAGFTAVVVNTAGTPSAYAGVTCTNQFLRILSALGAGTCATVSLTADVTGVTPVANGGTGATALSIRRNTLINGSFRVAQRGTTFTSVTTPANNDDTYLLDRWVFLADGADTADVSQELTTVPTGAYAACLLDVETANRKFGLLQIIEQRNAAVLIGGTATLSFKARRTGTSIANLRAAMVSWTGTADAPTSDVVSAWNAAGTDPTLVANWTYENVPSNLALTTSYQTFTVTNIAVDTASTKNVAVFIWVDDTDATVGDFVYVADAQLESGATASAFELIDYTTELLQCERYARVLVGGSLSERFGFGQAYSVTLAEIEISLRVEMRVVPTVTVSAASDFSLSGATFSGIALTAFDATPTLSGLTPWNGHVRATVAAGIVAGDAEMLFGNSSAKMTFDAEL